MRGLLGDELTLGSCRTLKGVIWHELGKDFLRPAPLLLQEFLAAGVFEQESLIGHLLRQFRLGLTLGLGLTLAGLNENLTSPALHVAFGLLVLGEVAGLLGVLLGLRDLVRDERERLLDEHHRGEEADRDVLERLAELLGQAVGGAFQTLHRRLGLGHLLRHVRLAGQLPF